MLSYYIMNKNKKYRCFIIIHHDSLLDSEIPTNIDKTARSKESIYLCYLLN